MMQTSERRRACKGSRAAAGRILNTMHHLLHRRLRVPSPFSHTLHPSCASSSTNMAERTSVPVNMPAQLLLHTLDEIDKDESVRIFSAREGTRGSSDADGEYASCSYTTQASRDRRNRGDNRWSNVHGYDHSLLPGPYLNASLIPPYPCGELSPPLKATSRRSYIASQAPLPHTLPTFYSNVVKNKVSLVVNLSAFVEGGRVKSDQYWPLNEAEVWNSTPGFKIRHRKGPQAVGKQVEHLWKATRYHLRLSSDEVGEVPKGDHNFDILHITCWPDFGSFSHQIFTQLLDAVNEIAKDGNDEQSTVWVHCSAGIGRSGTVIAALLAQDLGPALSSAMGSGALTTPSLLAHAALQASRKLVDHERRYRPKMVQTADQLGMIAEVVASVLQQSGKE